jgi:hypothetical protein
LVLSIQTAAQIERITPPRRLAAPNEIALREAQSISETSSSISPPEPHTALGKRFDVVFGLLVVHLYSSLVLIDALTKKSATAKPPCKVIKQPVHLLITL